MPRTSLIVVLIVAYLVFFLFLARLSFSQDAATGAIHGTVLDPTGSRIAKASIVAINSANGVRYSTTSDSEGRFALDLLPPGDTPPAPWRKACRRKSRRRFMLISAPPPNSNFVLASPAPRKTSPSPARRNWLTLNRAPSPP